MNNFRLFFLLTFYLTLNSCNQKTENVSLNENNIKDERIILKEGTKDEVEGTYTNTAGDCPISLIISKDKNEYQYVFKTAIRTLKGKARYSHNNSGEKYLVLEGIQWDEYEGDISNEEENDSLSSKELEIPVGIDALYVKDTLTIQNYGNAMNSYTKISECGLKYIQLIKKGNSKK
ncbi:hypothetical protein HYN56_04200 [Flavobacterium crocinum]|uniref:Uncharacterized protein n=1 Tax=Flavobacterium crocinum TaxID=2183896 RepID=A0A2S1YHE3_9FLAO|nr:hypothetical protein [Flavobacterium crocinum]AWK03466.1 hypothetical protein HYN56_04200 [Flavobacterium crocinum]